MQQVCIRLIVAPPDLLLLIVAVPHCLGNMNIFDVGKDLFRETTGWHFLMFHGQFKTRLLVEQVPAILLIVLPIILLHANVVIMRGEL